MRIVLLAIFAAFCGLVVGTYVFGQTGCEDVFAAAQEKDQVVCQKGSEINQTCMILMAQDVEGVEEISSKVYDTFPEYQKAMKTLGIARFLLDFTEAFEAAGVKVEGFTYENAARIATTGKDKLDSIEAKLDAIAEELRGILDRPDDPTASVDKSLLK